MIPTDSLTDLIGGTILIPMILVLRALNTDKIKEKEHWIAFFSFLAVSCIVGFIAHYYCESYSALAFKLIWIPLYPLLYETVVRFFLLARQIKFDDSNKNRKVLVHMQSAAAAFAALSILFCWVTPNKDLDIRLFTIFAATICITGFALIGIQIFSEKDMSAALMLSAIIPLLPAAYFQLERETVVYVFWEFNCNAISHVFIILSEFTLFASAVVRLSAKHAAKATPPVGEK